MPCHPLIARLQQLPCHGGKQLGGHLLGIEQKCSALAHVHCIQVIYTQQVSSNKSSVRGAMQQDSGEHWGIVTGCWFIIMQHDDA